MNGAIDTRPTSIVWLDGSADKTEENSAVQEQLRLLDKNLQIFIDKNQCEEYIKSQAGDAHITLIVNGSLGRELVPSVYQLSQIIAIYIYCLNKAVHEQWASAYDKVKGVFIEFSLLQKQLQTNPNSVEIFHSIIQEVPLNFSMESDEATTAASHIGVPPIIVSQSEVITTGLSQTEVLAPTVRETEATLTSSTEIPDITTSAPSEMPTTTVSQTEVSEATSSHVETVPIPFTYELDSSYMISDSFFDYLTRMKVHPEEIDDFKQLCQNTLPPEQTDLSAILREFGDGYSGQRAISWLYRSPFFYRFLDAIFKFICVDAMYPCRVFVNDIYKELKQHQCTSTIQVYRCEHVSNDMLQQLRTLNGKAIGMKYFFLANLIRETALVRESESDPTNECKRVLFIVDANPQIQNIKPFAKIGSLSNNNDPNDVLFMIGSVFKITDIEDENDGIMNIKLTLCANDDESQTKLMFDQIKYRYIDINGDTDALAFGQLLFDIGNSIGDSTMSKKGEDLIRSYLAVLPADHSDCSRCYDVLGSMEFSQRDFDSSLEWYQKSFDIKKEILPANDVNLAEFYQNMAMVHLEKRDFMQALECLKQVIIIWKTVGDDHINLIPCYTTIADIYEQDEKLFEALSYYSQAELIMIKHNITKDINFSYLCNNLGKLRTRFGHYHLALGYYDTSLEIKTKLLTSIDPSIATTYKNIGLVYGYMGNIQQAQINLEKAAEIYRQIQSPDNANLMEIEELIRNPPSESM